MRYADADAMRYALRHCHDFACRCHAADADADVIFLRSSPFAYDLHDDTAPPCRCFRYAMLAVFPSRHAAFAAMLLPLYLY